MKTTVSFLSVLLLYGTRVLAQDLPAKTPLLLPMSNTFAHTSSKHPKSLISEQPVKDAVSLVTGFLTDLVNGQYEAARRPLSENFRAYYPGFEEFLETDHLIEQSKRNQRLFTNQQITIETSKVVTVDQGSRQGQWVFLKVNWSAQDNRREGKPMQMTYYELAHILNDEIQRTYISYGNDQLFYDLGFPVYQAPREVTQKR